MQTMVKLYVFVLLGVLLPLVACNAGGPHWSQWAVVGKSCKKQCDSGKEKYKRNCIGGKTRECGGNRFKFQTCVDLPPCAEWAEWQPKGKCSEKCGAGQQKYKRKCNTLKPGKKCTGAKQEFKPCNLGACATWGEWQDGECSTTCGVGTMKQTRECQVGIGRCKGGKKQEVACNKGACAAWGDWKDGDCSVTCGVGTIKSTRECVGIGECDGEAEKSAVCDKGDCVTPCAAPSIPNGASTCDRSASISFGAPCTVSCEDGFEMKGDATITCGDSNNDGKGDFVLPTCQVPHGGMMYNGDVFVYLPEKRDVNRQQAIDACKELGDYHLAYVKSTEAMQAIYDYALPLKPKDWGSNHMYLWLGGTVIPTTGLNNINPVNWEDGTNTHYNDEKLWNGRSRLGHHNFMSLVLLDSQNLYPGPYVQNIWESMASLSWPLCQKAA